MRRGGSSKAKKSMRTGCAESPGGRLQSTAVNSVRVACSQSPSRLSFRRPSPACHRLRTLNSAGWASCRMLTRSKAESFHSRYASSSSVKTSKP
jgi:hypothetical protein